MVDSTEGHVYPTFGLAHSLKSTGHSITYLSISDYKNVISKQGFEVYTIPHDSLAQRIIQGELDTFFESAKPDLLIINIFLLLEALILHYKYKLWPVILTPYLQTPVSPMIHQCTGFFGQKKGSEAVLIGDYLQSFGKRSAEEILYPVSKFPELILCPRELEIEPLPGKRKSHYIQPSIHTEPSYQGAHQINLPENKQIIYASLGSNAKAYDNQKRARFYRTVINTIRNSEIPDLQLIMTIGRGFDTAQLGDLPENITLVDWAPQVTILKKTALAIIHGGLGSIKECIYYGVPMIIVPMGFEQDRNGRIMNIRRLGITREIDMITQEILLSDICHILGDREIKENILAMQQIFREREASQPGSKVIEALLQHLRQPT